MMLRLFTCFVLTNASYQGEPPKGEPEEGVWIPYHSCDNQILPIQDFWQNIVYPYKDFTLDSGVALNDTRELAHVVMKVAVKEDAIMKDSSDETE